MDNERLDALFEAAVMIPPAERARWLDGHCGGNPQLRRELERLLAADAIAEGVLEHAPELLADSMADAIEMPQRFGIWRVLGVLGAGGMGEVWLAERDDGQFQQRVAIKQVAWPTPGLLRRFREERQILARLEHPGIARLIDGGVDDSGCPWLAMEYVEGEPITQWVRGQRSSVRDTIELTLHICDAVQFAHRNLIVHSDIKPSNILVTDGTPKLLDFGIAKVLTQDDSERTRTMTQPLTPDYAAPELLAGGAVTTSVDVYALGVLLYKLLSGNKPYRLAALGGTSALAAADIKPPSAVIDHALPDANARRRIIRGDLDRIVLTAMAREPARRYASVEALAADLRRWLQGRAIAAHGHGRWYRLGKFVRRNRVAVAIGSAATLALMATSIFALWQAHQAHLQAAQARIQADNVEAVKNFMVGVFSEAGPGDRPGIGPSARQLLDSGARNMRHQFNDDPEIAAALSDALAKSYAGIGAFDKAREFGFRSIELNSSLHGAGSGQTALARVQYAEILRNGWWPEQAKQQARAVIASTHDRPGEASVRAHLVIAGADSEQGRFAGSAQAEAAHALQLAQALGPGGARWQAAAWNAVAEIALGRKDYAAAQHALRETAALYARSRGENAAETYQARTDLVFLLVHRGHLAEGLNLEAQMVAEQRANAADDPQYIDTLINYAYILSSAGRLKQSRETAAQALSLLAGASDMPPAQREDGFENLAIMARARGDLTGALRILDRADRLMPLLGDFARTARSLSQWKRAGVAAERGEPNAIAQLEALRAHVSKPGAPLDPSKQLEWPLAWLAGGRADLALQRYRELLAAPADPHAVVSHRAELLLGEGIALVQLGRFDEAKKVLDQVVALSTQKAEYLMQGVSAQLWLGWAQVGAGHARAGLHDIEQALAWRRDQLGDDSYFTGEALLAHAEALAQIDRREQAQRERAQAQALFAVQLSPNHVLSRRAQLPLP